MGKQAMYKDLQEIDPRFDYGHNRFQQIAQSCLHIILSYNVICLDLNPVTVIINMAYGLEYCGLISYD